MMCPMTVQVSNQSVLSRKSIGSRMASKITMNEPSPENIDDSDESLVNSAVDESEIIETQPEEEQKISHLSTLVCQQKPDKSTAIPDLFKSIEPILTNVYMENTYNEQQ